MVEPGKPRKRREVKPDSRKQSLWFPKAMIDELQAGAARQDRSLSLLMQKAWKNARRKIKKRPSFAEEAAALGLIDDIGLDGLRVGAPEELGDLGGRVISGPVHISSLCQLPLFP